MNEEAVNAILRRMSDYMDNSQMIKLKIVLEEAVQKDGIIADKSSQELLEMFLSNKRLEGRSEKTLALYRFNIEKMLSKSEKNVCVMNTDDIRKYLSDYRERNGRWVLLVMLIMYIRINFAAPWQRPQLIEEYQLNRCSSFWGTRKLIQPCSIMASKYL